MEDKIPEKSKPHVKVSVTSVIDIEEGHPPISQPKVQRLHRFGLILRRPFLGRNISDESPWLKVARRALYLFTAVIVLAVIAVV